MTDDKELLTLIKARAKTIGQACDHFKIPSEGRDQPLTILALLYLVMRIQNGPTIAEKFVLSGPIEALSRILKNLEQAAQGTPLAQSTDDLNTVTLSSDQLTVLINTRMTKKGH